MYHFQSQSDSAANLRLPQRHVILGDMGTKCAFTLCPPCTCDAVCDAVTCASNHSSGLVTEVGKYFGGQDGEEATMFLHVGDFGCEPAVSVAVGAQSPQRGTAWSALSAACEPP